MKRHASTQLDDHLDRALASALPPPPLPPGFQQRLRRAHQGSGAGPRGGLKRPAPAVSPPSPASRGVTVNDGALEAIKWLALVLMTGDHINKYLLGGQVHALYAAGRLVFPLFAFVFAYNLARPGALANGAYQRAMTRLAAVGALASVPFIGLGGLLYGWWPFNILASFLLSAATMHLVERGGVARMALAALLFLAGGLFVEFWWPGIAMTLAAWCYVRRPSAGALLTWIAATAALGCIPWLLARVPMALSLWALAALPVIALASRLQLRVPRLRWAFYAYYPAHLAVLWAIQNLQ
jgi:hypothetical protein